MTHNSLSLPPFFAYTTYPAVQAKPPRCVKLTGPLPRRKKAPVNAALPCFYGIIAL
jgi:hypothetical protein